MVEDLKLELVQEMVLLPVGPLLIVLLPKGAQKPASTGVHWPALSRSVASLMVPAGHGVGSAEPSLQ